MKRNIILICTFLTVFAFADKKGEDIARKSHNLQEADDSYSIASMILVDKNGNKKSRKLEMYSKNGSEGTNSFVEFLEPGDVKGTKFLTIAHKGSDDEQRLYLPELKKVRRISSSGKDGKFMGSDLSFYDMEDRDFEDSNYKFLKEGVTISDKAFSGMKFYVIEARDKDEDAPYEKSVMYVNMDNYFVYKVETYAKKGGKLYKTILMFDVKKIKGVFMPGKTLVINHKDGSKTLLSMDNIQINIGVKDSIFSVKNLEK